MNRRLSFLTAACALLTTLAAAPAAHAAKGTEKITLICDYVHRDVISGNKPITRSFVITKVNGQTVEVLDKLRDEVYRLQETRVESKPAVITIFNDSPISERYTRLIIGTGKFEGALGLTTRYVGYVGVDSSEMQLWDNGEFVSSAGDTGTCRRGQRGLF